jgi:putative endonuclease
MESRSKQSHIEINSNLNQILGVTGESVVANYLQANGYSILCKNYRKKFGEIDIIAQYKNVITFIEVKTRKDNYFNLSQVITPSKQKKIILTAKDFILKGKFIDKIYRFDVALVVKEGDCLNLNYIENAFYGK